MIEKFMIIKIKKKLNNMFVQLINFIQNINCIIKVEFNYIFNLPHWLLILIMVLIIFFIDYMLERIPIVGDDLC